MGPQLPKDFIPLFALKRTCILLNSKGFHVTDETKKGHLPLCRALSIKYLAKINKAQQSPSLLLPPSHNLKSSTMTALRSILKCTETSHNLSCSVSGRSHCSNSISNASMRWSSQRSTATGSSEDHCRRRGSHSEAEEGCCPLIEVVDSRSQRLQRRRSKTRPTGKPAKRSVSFPGLTCRWESSGSLSVEKDSPSPNNDDKCQSPRKPERRSSLK